MVEVWEQRWEKELVGKMDWGLMDEELESKLELWKESGMANILRWLDKNQCLLQGGNRPSPNSHSPYHSHHPTLADQNHSSPNI